MHAGLKLIIYWGGAFLSLGMALVLLSIFFGCLGNNLALRSAGSEAAIAGLCSLVEALSFWLVATFIPLGSQALILPVVVVALVYRVAHYEDWGRMEILLLLVFQVVIGFLSVSLFFGHYRTAIYLAVGFGAVLAVFAFFARGLWD
jgi:hypothetical protein